MTRRVRVTGGAHFRRRASQLAAVAAALLVWVAATAAQSSTITAVKAALLYNFANLAEWPADSRSPGQRLSLGVAGDNGVADALTDTIKGRTARGHDLTVEVLKGASVFTASDSDKFAESGGIAQLIIENDRMRSAINAAAADRADSPLLEAAQPREDGHG
jgi:hypothetical protein